jgi:hypothetical protein
MKMAVFWDVAPCRVVDTDRRWKETYQFHRQGLKIKKRGREIKEGTGHCRSSVLKRTVCAGLSVRSGEALSHFSH